jgi:hypothetical protein
MSDSQRRDLLAQKALFDSARSMLELEFYNQIVGYVANVLRSGPEIHELLDRAKKEFPGRMIYLEPIGFSLASGF